MSNIKWLRRKLVVWFCSDMPIKIHTLSLSQVYNSVITKLKLICKLESWKSITFEVFSR